MRKNKEKYLKLEHEINDYIQQDFVDGNKKIDNSIEGKGKISSGLFSRFEESKDREKEERSGVTIKIL